MKGLMRTKNEVDKKNWYIIKLNSFIRFNLLLRGRELKWVGLTVRTIYPVQYMSNVQLKLQEKKERINKSSQISCCSAATHIYSHVKEQCSLYLAINFNWCMHVISSLYNSCTSYHLFVQNQLHAYAWYC